MPQSDKTLTNINYIMSLLRCADDALVSGDECEHDVIQLHSLSCKLLEEIKSTLAG